MADGVRSIIFDYGGVLGLPQDASRVAAMAAFCGLSLEEFRRAYQHDRLDLDRGTLAREDYWRRILAAGKVTPTPDLLARLDQEELLSWSLINSRVLGWSRELRSAGYRTAILSNMPRDILTHMMADPAFRWMSEFDARVFSCQEGLVKPEPEIYRLCLRRLGHGPENSLFLDDVPGNVAGAQAVGIPAVLWSTPRLAAVELGGKWGLPVNALKEERS